MQFFVAYFNLYNAQWRRQLLLQINLAAKLMLLSKYGEWVAAERGGQQASEMQQAAVAVAVAVAVADAIAAAEHARVKRSYLCRNNRNLVN